MIIWMMSLTALLGFMAVAFAAGEYVQSNGNSQNAADAAALAAATIVGQSGSPLTAEQTAADKAEGLAQSYGQVPDGASSAWQNCSPPKGFTPGDPDQTNCVAFAEASGAQTLVSRAGPVVTLAAPGTLSSGGTVAAGVVAAVSGVVDSGGTGVVSLFLYESGAPDSPPSSCVTDSGILPVGWSPVATFPASAGTAQYGIPSLDAVSLSTGYYWWEAYYDGTGTGNLSESSGCDSEQTVVSGNESLGLSVPDVATAGAPVGGGAGDVVAQLSGTTGTTNSDTVSFYVDGPSASAPAPSCNSGSGGWSEVGNAINVSGNTTYTPTSAFTPPRSGNYWWDAMFTPATGDTTNPVMHSSCSVPAETVVALAAPRLSLSAPSSAAVGSPLPLSGAGGADVAAQLLGTTGSTNGDTITFYESGPSTSAPACFTSANGQAAWTPVGTASVTDDGTYSPTTTFAPASEGDYWWDAVFSTSATDTTNGSADSSCSVPVRTVVGVAATTPTLSLSVPNTAVVGEIIDPNAVVTDISGLAGSGGKIAFYVADPSTNDGTCPSTLVTSGWDLLGSVTDGTDTTYTLQEAGGTLSALPDPGELAWYASYGGDSEDSPAGTPCGVVTWVEVPGQSLPTILGTSVDQGGSTSYAVYSYASGIGDAKLCYYPGNCATA